MNAADLTKMDYFFFSVIYSHTRTQIHSTTTTTTELSHLLTNFGLSTECWARTHTYTNKYTRSSILEASATKRKQQQQQHARKHVYLAHRNAPLPLLVIFLLQVFIRFSFSLSFSLVCVCDLVSIWLRSMNVQLAAMTRVYFEWIKLNSFFFFFIISCLAGFCVYYFVS